MCKNLYEVLYRYEEDFEHIIVYKNGILISDRYEGFPKIEKEGIVHFLKTVGVSNTSLCELDTIRLLEDLVKRGFITLEIEKIEENL